MRKIVYAISACLSCAGLQTPAAQSRSDGQLTKTV